MSHYVIHRFKIYYFRLGDAESFMLEGFEFELLDHQVTDDILIYDLTYGEFRTRLHVLEIDSVKPCGPESNVDFVRFVWDNREDFSFLNYVITVLPITNTGCSRLPQTIYICHHRAESDGWKHPRGCSECASTRSSQLSTFNFYCKSPDPCLCFICRRQLPSLAVSASNILFKFVLNLDLFQLRRNATYGL
jgi:hypothetical protein